MPIETINLGHIYDKDSEHPFIALNDININIKDGSFVAVIGKTGSGKTTLVQHFNALLKPDKGSLIVDDIKIESNDKLDCVKDLRKKVGYVFQFSEYQLFEETILKDVSFGPKNFGYSEEEAIEKAKKSLEIVGINKDFFEKNPFELSGGQKRRIAIAGVLAVNPDILILDEPTAGLDPQGCKDMMNLFLSINRKLNKTIIMITHDMDHVFNYCDEVIVMDDSKCVFSDSKENFFRNDSLISNMEEGNIPNIIKLNRLLIDNNLISKDINIKTIDDAVKAIEEAINE